MTARLTRNLTLSELKWQVFAAKGLLGEAKR
jgi:hypothetical protein